MMTSEPRRPAIPLERMPTPQMLSCVEPFTVSPQCALDRIAAASSRQRVPAGTLLVRDGELAAFVYVVLRGRMNLIRCGAAGRGLILASLGAGEIFGESCLLAGVRASTSAVAGAASDLCRLPAAVSRRHLDSHPAASARLMRLMHDRMRDLESVASGLALCDVEERLRRTLATLARRQGRRERTSRDWVLVPAPTQSELARMVGSCRETVSRTLTAMAREGLVTTVGRKMLLSEKLVETLEGVVQPPAV
ncbi:MAG: Crp/Fnr family transcriptional regulator [Nannocystaceae bacterium]